MSNTVITPQTPSEDEYAIVATFSNSSLKQIINIQQKLESLLGKVIWLTPPRALHSTLMEIICDTDYKILSRKQHFDNWLEKYNHVVAEILSKTSSFELSFSQIEVSQRAIILKSADSGNFNAIRSEILSRTTLPAETKLPPDITHCTVARFSEVLSLEEVRDKVEVIQINLHEHLKDFKLLKDLGPPTFAPKLIQTYELEV